MKAHGKYKKKYKSDFIGLRDDPDYGFTHMEITTGYNLEKLWIDYPDEDRFIKAYAQTVQHECLHVENVNALWDMWWDQEERVVQLMTGEKRLKKK